MHHKARWTTQRIEQYLRTIEPLVHRIRQPFQPFRLKVMDGPEERVLVNSDVNDSDWPMIQSNTYWAEWFTDFTLRTHFTVPLDWDAQLPVALHLPLGVVAISAILKPWYISMANRLLDSIAITRKRCYALIGWMGGLICWRCMAGRVVADGRIMIKAHGR